MAKLINKAGVEVKPGQKGYMKLWNEYQDAKIAKQQVRDKRHRESLRVVLPDGKNTVMVFSSRDRRDRFLEKLRIRDAQMWADLRSSRGI